MKHALSSFMKSHDPLGLFLFVLHSHWVSPNHMNHLDSCYLFFTCDFFHVFSHLNFFSSSLCPSKNAARLNTSSPFLPLPGIHSNSTINFGIFGIGYMTMICKDACHISFTTCVHDFKITSYYNLLAFRNHLFSFVCQCVLCTGDSCLHCSSAHWRLDCLHKFSQILPLQTLIQSTKRHCPHTRSDCLRHIATKSVSAVLNNTFR